VHVKGATDPAQETLLARLDCNGYGVPQKVRDILTAIGYSCHYSSKDDVWEIHNNRDPTTTREARFHYFMGRRRI
jgi:hypothetical protein